MADALMFQFREVCVGRGVTLKYKTLFFVCVFELNQRVSCTVCAKYIVLTLF